MGNSFYQISFWAAIALILLYTLGQHWRTAHRELMQTIGIGGVAFIIFWSFFSSCPSVAAGFVFKLFIAALIIKFFVWLFFESYYRNLPEELRDSGKNDSFSADSPPDIGRRGHTISEVKSDRD